VLFRSNELKPGEIWSVRDVSFSLRRGEALGIIGLNGSGKTTLLRMLAGHILPDQGEVRVAGRSASVIALTAGLDLTATGRRNIELRSAMLGRSQAETHAALDDIIAFTELGEAIDAPVQTYSSGMTLRLAFAITVSSTPDLLLIDETLSVGDFLFRQKCLAKVRELRDRAAFVLVSHSMPDIERFCDRAFVLHKGAVVFDGEPKDATAYYMKEQMADGAALERPMPPAAVGQFVANEAAVTRVRHGWVDAHGAPVTKVRSGGPIFFELEFDLAHEPRDLVIGVPVWADDGSYVTGFSSEIAKIPRSTRHDGTHVYRLAVPKLSLKPGVYLSNISIVDGPEFLYRQPNPPLEVTPAGHPHFGLVTLDHSWG